jgi:putative protein-disulfide isomerase
MKKALFAFFLVITVQLNMIAQETKPQLIYVGDPMCSWCYGFSDELVEIAETFKNDVDFKVIVGGLRPFTKDPWDSDLQHFLRKHWIEIGKETGQKFNLEILNQPNFVYDTEPAARAYKVLESLKAPKLEIFKSIQELFYFHNTDPKTATAYVDICKKYKVSFDEFKTAFVSDDFKQLTKNDFQYSQQMGVRGFPSLVLIINNQATMITNGYQKAENIIQTINNIL